MASISFPDFPVTVQDGSYSFKVAVPGRVAGSGKGLGSSPPTLVFPGGMKERFLHVKDIVDAIFLDLSFLTETKSQYLKPGAMMAIVAIETGPVARSSNPTDSGMLYVTPDNISKYNPRVTSPAHAINIPQVTLNTGQEYGNAIKDYWNYAESLRGAVNYLNVVLNYVEIAGNRDATLLTAAMGYNAGHGHKKPSVFWGIGETREYAKRYYQAYNQVVYHHYPTEAPYIDYDKYVDSFDLVAQ